ncbi:MAG TPA: DUF305 domain-containing protein [Pilimelia sp.]|nr:DUF305 domain-containing protein [Pilimelia sp.]
MPQPATEAEHSAASGADAASAPDAVPADPPPDAGSPAPPGVGDPGRRGFGNGVVAAAIVAGLLLGYALGWLMPRLTAPGEDSVEAGFARDMTSHHAQAVEMGLIAHQRGTSPNVRSMAGEIVTGQQGEIGLMQGWLDRWNLEPTGSAPPMAWMPEGMRDLGPDGLMPGLASQAELDRLRSMSGNEFDVYFLQLMIRHHVGGIHMIDEALKVGDREVRELATIMKRSQTADLDALNRELRRLGGTPLPAN